MNFYNDNDRFNCAWLREWIKAGHIAPGVVDQRSICEIKAEELEGFDQCHFFAGIGGWSLALRLAGWPEGNSQSPIANRRGQVWTGSCPCQPLSCAGQRKGHADERHLWPAFYALIAQRRPATVFGEQVAGADGREWLAGVRADLEGVGYAVGAADLCAAGVAAPQIGQRLYWVASTVGSRLERFTGKGDYRDESGRLGAQDPAERDSCRSNTDGPGPAGGVGEAASNGWFQGTPPPSREEFDVMRPGFWSDFDLCHFTGPDAGKIRRVEPGTFPLADGVSARVGRLRGYGNAIVPQVAAEFVRAFLEVSGNR